MRVPYMDIHAEYHDVRERKLIDLRRDGLADFPLLGWSSYLSARPDLPLHHHWGVIEIVYLERGRLSFEVESTRYDLRGGEALVTLPDEPHSTGGHPMEPSVFYWLNLRVPKRGRSLLALPSAESRSLIDALQNLPQRHFRGGASIKASFDRLLKLHAQPEASLRTLRMRQSMLQLLLEVIDCAVRRTPEDRVRRMAEVVESIRTRPGEEHRLRDLARQTGLSLTRFKLRFKAETGSPPQKFILRAKIDAACRLLGEGAAPIGQIALDLGFPTPQYFATVFKRIMGVSPRSYRRKAPRCPAPGRRGDDGQY